MTKHVTLRHVEKIKPWLVTSERDATGFLIHPDSRRCSSKGDAEKTAKFWSFQKGVKFIVEKR